MNTVKRVIVVLNIPKHVPDLIKLGHSVVDALTTHAATFPSPNPPLSKVSADLAALDGAETTAQTKAKGTAEARDVKRAAVLLDLQYLKGYVQQVADSNPAEAEAIAMSAAMNVRKPNTRQQVEFDARQGARSGEVNLIARSMGNRSAYEWEMSADQKNWVSAGVTVVAKALATGLTPATNYAFRNRTTTSAGTGEWSQVIDLIVK